MKTSIAEIVRTENYLMGRLSPEEALVFEAKMLLDKELKANTLFHKIVHRLVLLYHRKKLRARVEEVHGRLFSDPARERFQESVLRHFNR